MKVCVIKACDITDAISESVSQLLHEAFEERRMQGINFKCGMFSSQDVKNEFANKGGFLLLALDDFENIIGTVSLIDRSNAKYKYVSHDNLAVSNANKGKGVATLLFKKALSLAYLEGYDFIVSFTATTAKSSVLFHKKMGFVIYAKFYGSNYNSYGFIYPLKKMMIVRFLGVGKVVFMLKTLVNYIKNVVKKC